ncbi:hypothetical protein [Lysinibacillus fusiformis]|uniref:hypothetical protein n=1 Tax=Lysinibacillus fusiformis TaxID=28031 RepID=UPI001882527F|nr:hypothetical protein [Lysinibacillus fusiformis]MBD8523955.1 hypothetical protein [Lysinibacillus fusiformis]
MRARYALIEVYDFYSSNGATISEIELFDANNKKINYRPIDVYDSHTGGLPSYWNNASLWGKTNLNDSEISYTDNWSGAYSTTLFLWNGSPNRGNWARFVLDLGGFIDVTLINMWVGSPEGRIPHNIKVFLSEQYDSTNVSGRQNTKLSFIQQINFTINNKAVKLYQIEIEPEMKFLIVNQEKINTFNTEWITLDTSEITKDLIDSSGFSGLNKVDRKLVEINSLMIQDEITSTYNTLIDLNKFHSLMSVRIK